MYYSFPTRKDFDGCIRNGNNLLIVQMKAVQDLNKILRTFQKFRDSIDDLQRDLGEILQTSSFTYKI